MFFFLTLLDDPEEQQKFTEIYYQYRHFLWYVANQKLQDAHLAEDAVQEAFLALTRHMDKIEDVHSDRARRRSCRKNMANLKSEVTCWITI